MNATEATDHVFLDGPIYDGRCMHCDLRRSSPRATEPCSAPA